ncbi:MAG TPA: PDZ domain-containing protein [Pyrinomonadaceae bacterium]|nr:PDZ domain-containing protein [Pyrinomonadaceae bacterium]
MSSKIMKTNFHRLLMFLIAATAVMSLTITGRAQTVAPPTSTVAQSPTTAPTTAPATLPEKIQPRRSPRRASTPPATVTVVADQAKVAPQVVTIVHRLSGVKMLRFLLRQGEDPSTIYTFDSEAISNDAHASIIAGWALNDGRTIAVRLPQAGAELEFAALPFSGPEWKAQTAVAGSTRLMRVWNPPEPDLTVITRDGRKLRARYVGLDGQTGLSVLQVNALVLPPLTEEVTRELSQGQGVQIFAPERTTPEGEGSSRNIYVKVGEVDTKIFTLTKGAGKLERLTVRGAGLSPLVIGGIACDQAGNTLGIVESIEGGDARIVPADTIRAAARRVLERQASVPRPLLGVVGEPVEFAKRAAFLANGWHEDQLTDLLRKNLGILLTAVGPGTPAALAKLYPGDIIVRVNQEDIESSEEFSKVLGEAGSGQQVQFLVRRPSAPAPFPIDVKLGGSFDPVFKYRFEFPAIARKPGWLAGLGVETIAISPKSLAQLGAENGVLVVAVEPESIAARNGLREGDVIESIDGRVLRRGAATAGVEFNRRKRHVLSLVRKREKKQVILEPIE